METAVQWVVRSACRTVRAAVWQNGTGKNPVSPARFMADGGGILTARIWNDANVLQLYRQINICEKENIVQDACFLS